MWSLTEHLNTLLRNGMPLPLWPLELVLIFDLLRSWHSLLWKKSLELAIAKAQCIRHGGRHFKFVFICTHQEHAKSGDN